MVMLKKNIPHFVFVNSIKNKKRFIESISYYFPDSQINFSCVSEEVLDIYVSNNPKYSRWKKSNNYLEYPYYLKIDNILFFKEKHKKYISVQEYNAKVNQFIDYLKKDNRDAVLSGNLPNNMNPAWLGKLENEVKGLSEKEIEERLIKIKDQLCSPKDLEQIPELRRKKMIKRWEDEKTIKGIYYTTAIMLEESMERILILEYFFLKEILRQLSKNKKRKMKNKLGNYCSVDQILCFLSKEQRVNMLNNISRINKQRLEEQLGEDYNDVEEIIKDIFTSEWRKYGILFYLWFYITLPFRFIKEFVKEFSHWD